MQTAMIRKYVKLTLLDEFSSHEFISHVEPESPLHIVVISAKTQNALYFMFYFISVLFFNANYDETRRNVCGMLFVYTLTMVLK